MRTIGAVTVMVGCVASLSVPLNEPHIVDDTMRPGKLPWEIAATYPYDIYFSEHADTPRRVLETGETEATFYSDLRELAPGEVVFTDPTRTHIEMPKGDVVLTSVQADVVDANKRPVPLNEVYLHHWIMLDKDRPNDGVCGGYLTYIFGVGAETRDTPYDFPQYKGNTYGWTTTSNHRWTANIHVLRTVNIDPDEHGGLKGCIECQGPNKWCPGQKGGFECCPDRSFCPTIKYGDERDDKKQYYFRYIVKYVEAGKNPNSPGGEARQGANYILDVSVPQCNIEYNIEANPTTGLSETLREWTIGHDTRFFQMWGHIHIAGYNITLYHGDSTKAKPICTSSPRYGTQEGVVGNEKGYVVSMSKCMFTDDPYIIRKGDKLTLQALYNVGETDDRTWLEGGFHNGVMGLYFMTGSPCKTQACDDASEEAAYLAEKMEMQAFSDATMA